jgi:hypothetical protein
MHLYAAKLLFVVLVEDGAPRRKNTWDSSFVIVRAATYEHAFEHALQVGRGHVVRYKNSKGRNVRWAFAKVESIKQLERNLHGQEVGSSLSEINSRAPLPYGQRFQPGRSRPAFL